MCYTQRMCREIASLSNSVLMLFVIILSSICIALVMRIRRMEK